MAFGVVELLQAVDAQLEKTLNEWNIYTSILCVVLVSAFLYPFIFTVEPDTHPFLLARQTTVSRVRQSGESAVYRALETPHGGPLRTGLRIRETGAPVLAFERDGDLRDIWRRAALGPKKVEGKPAAEIGKIYTLLGKEEVVESTFDKLSAELNAVGKDLKKHGSSRVAIYLSNSPEFLVALFATVFYGLTPILISQEQSLEGLATILEKTNADALVVGAGSVPLSELGNKYGGLKEVLWVVPKSSRHLDWNEVAEGEGGKVEITVWHDIVDEEGAFASSELPTDDTNSELPNVIVVSSPTEKLHNYEIVEYTQKNLVAAIGAQLSALPYNHRINSKDLLLPLLPLTNTYALTITLSALLSNASVALTAVTGEAATYRSAFNSSPRVSPTIIVIDPVSLYRETTRYKALLQKKPFLVRWWTTYRHNGLVSSMNTTGAFPARSSGSRLEAEDGVRLIYTENVSYPVALNDLRIYTGARITVGLTHPLVTGVISQTNMLDYRATKNSEAHFGPPVSSVEIKLRETDGYTIDDDGPDESSSGANGSQKLPSGGKLVISGPAVVGPRGTEVVIEDRVFRITDTATIGIAKRSAQAEQLKDVKEKALQDAMLTNQPEGNSTE